MSDVLFVGDDTVTANLPNFPNLMISADFGKGDYFKFTYEGDIGDVIAGKNGNTLAYRKFDGIVTTAELRIVRGSNSDIAFNSTAILQLSSSSFAPFTMTAARFFTINGVFLTEKFNVTSCLFVKYPEVVFSSSGNEEQAHSVYSIKCTVQNLSPRSIG